MSFPPNRNHQGPSGYKHGPRRQAQLPSQSGITFNGSPGQQPVRPPVTPSSPPRTSPPFPSMVFDRNAPQTDFQRWGGEQLMPFLRWAYPVYHANGSVAANAGYESDIDNAVHLSETIVCIPSFLLHL